MTDRLFCEDPVYSFVIDGCVSFLKKQAQELELPYQVFELVPKKPLVVITWQGSQPELPSILLNSHMDVVPVYEVDDKTDKYNTYLLGSTSSY